MLKSYQECFQTDVSSSIFKFAQCGLLGGGGLTPLLGSSSSKAWGSKRLVHGCRASTFQISRPWQYFSFDQTLPFFSQSPTSLGHFGPFLSLPISCQFCRDLPVHMPSSTVSKLGEGVASSRLSHLWTLGLLQKGDTPEVSE